MNQCLPDVKEYLSDLEVCIWPNGPAAINENILQPARTHQTYLSCSLPRERDWSCSRCPEGLSPWTRHGQQGVPRRAQRRTWTEAMSRRMASPGRGAERRGGLPEVLEHFEMELGYVALHWTRFLEHLDKTAVGT